MRGISKLSAFICILVGTSAYAQERDMWTQLADKTGTFSPHINNCDSSEVYVTIGGGILGYCIEKNYRTAAAWDDAKEACASIGKRLPEPAEWKHACKYPPTGLGGMSGHWEWTSNTAIPLDAANYDRIVAAIMGGGGCTSGSWDVVASSNLGEASYAFRCVR